MTKNDIRIKLDMIKSMKNRIVEIEKELKGISECEECQEMDFCESVLWYPESEDQEYLNTCSECQIRFKKDIA